MQRVKGHNVNGLIDRLVRQSGIEYYVDKKRNAELFNLVTRFGNNTYLVPSLTDNYVYYMVDMVNGFCECTVGNDEPPCKHQALKYDGLH